MTDLASSTSSCSSELNVSIGSSSDPSTYSNNQNLKTTKSKSFFSIEQILGKKSPRPNENPKGEDSPSRKRFKKDLCHSDDESSGTVSDNDSSTVDTDSELKADIKQSRLANEEITREKTSLKLLPNISSSSSPCLSQSFSSNLSTSSSSSATSTFLPKQKEWSINQHLTLNQLTKPCMIPKFAFNNPHSNQMFSSPQMSAFQSSSNLMHNSGFHQNNSTINPLYFSQFNANFNPNQFHNGLMNHHNNFHSHQSHPLLVKPKKKRSRAAFSHAQVLELEKRFNFQRYLSGPERADLASSLKVCFNNSS